MGRKMSLAHVWKRENSFCYVSLIKWLQMAQAQSGKKHCSVAAVWVLMCLEETGWYYLQKANKNAFNMQLTSDETDTYTHTEPCRQKNSILHQTAFLWEKATTLCNRHKERSAQKWNQLFPRVKQCMTQTFWTEKKKKKKNRWGGWGGRRRNH